MEKLSEMNRFDSTDENYLDCIATMTIDNNQKDNDHSDQSDDSDSYSDTIEAEIDKETKTMKRETGRNETTMNESKENDAGVDKDTESNSLAQLYLDDMEINRSDEEQTISELVRASVGSEVMEIGRNSRMRVAFGIIIRLVLPLANGFVRGIQGIRDVRFLRILSSVASSRQAFTNLIAFAANTISMNLSSVQVSHRIEPILKLLKIRKSRDGLESLPDIPNGDAGIAPATPIAETTANTSLHPIPLYSPFIRAPKGSLANFSSKKRKSPAVEQPAPNCCTLNILAEPAEGTPIRADIIFIHGLHGSLVNTWKQGLWENDRQPVEFNRPPKPPVRPPKRPRHSRSNQIHPPHKQKRARFTSKEHFKQSSDRDTHDECGDWTQEKNGNQYSYKCGEPGEIQVCDGIEYSFPTFRLRMDDNGRQIQAELDSILNNHNIENNRNNNNSNNNNKNYDNNDHQMGSNKKRNKTQKTRTKPSPDDPNYSKCWPGDWLPLDCPGVRVIAVNYTTDQYLWRPLWKKKETRSNLVQRSREMAELLVKHRVGYGHPIVWVGHSKGGLFIKQIIVDAWESGRPAVAPFWRSAKGVFFYSVPHRGSHLASIKAPLLARSVELLDIEKNSKYLIDLHRRFAGLYHMGHLKIEVFSFVETALTLMSLLYLRIVGVDSADPGIGDVCGIRLDHREICKPQSRECILYKQLVKMINKVC